MNEVIAFEAKRIELGRVGENAHTRVKFDISDFLEEYPDAEVSLLNQRPGDVTAYPVLEIEISEDWLYWTVMSSALNRQGTGRCELIVRKDGVIVKSVIYGTRILAALDDTAPAPEPWESWQEHFEDVARQAQASAESASASEESAAESAGEAAASANDAESSKNDAAAEALKSEGWARGTQNGQEAQSGDYYQDNAKYYKEQAAQSAQSAQNASIAIQDMDVATETLSPDSDATVQKTVDVQTGKVTLTFGVPQGANTLISFYIDENGALHCVKTVNADLDFYIDEDGFLHVTQEDEQYA